MAARSDLAAVQAPAWFGFLYVSLFSMFLGFFAWYGGLARGGVARIGQVQLAQPLLTLGFAVVVLGELVTPATLVTAVVVLACVVATQRARVATVSGTGAGVGLSPSPRVRPPATDVSRWLSAPCHGHVGRLPSHCEPSSERDRGHPFVWTASGGQVSDQR